MKILNKTEETIGSVDIIFFIINGILIGGAGLLRPGYAYGHWHFCVYYFFEQQNFFPILKIN